MMRRFILAALVAVLLLPTVVCVTSAQAGPWDEPTERAERWDFSIQTRYTGSSDFTGDNGESLSLSDDLGWGIGFNYNFNARFNMGFFFNWRSVYYDATVVDDSTPPNSTDYSNVLDTSTVAMSFYYYVMPKKLTPYLTGSLGWTLLDSNITSGISTGCWWDPWYGYVCSNYPTSYGADAFSYSLGVGVRLEVSPSVYFNVGYDRNWLDVNVANGFNIFRLDLGMTF
jgi:opacity protein-like surface antigen